MFYYGIKFHGISHENINLFIREILDIKQNNILNSHFYTDDLGDFEYSDKTDLSAVCQGSFAAVMNVARLSFHRIYHNVLCLILNDDSGYLTVECSIAESDFVETEIPNLKKWFVKLCDEQFISSAEIFDDYE